MYPAFAFVAASGCPPQAFSSPSRSRAQPARQGIPAGWRLGAGHSFRAKFKKGDFNSTSLLSNLEAKYQPSLALSAAAFLALYFSLLTSSLFTSHFFLFTYLYPPNCLHPAFWVFLYLFSNIKSPPAIINHRSSIFNSLPACLPVSRILPSKNPPQELVVPPSIRGTTAACFKPPSAICSSGSIPFDQNSCRDNCSSLVPRNNSPFSFLQSINHQSSIINHQSSIINQNSSLPPFVPPFVPQKRIARPAP